MYKKLLLLSAVLLGVAGIFALREYSAGAFPVSGEPDEVGDTGQVFVVSYRSSDYALNAQKELAIRHVSKGDGEAAQAAVAGLTRDFARRGKLAAAVNKTANKYVSRRQYEPARRLFKHIIATKPDSEGAMWAQTSLVRLGIALGDDRAAKAVVGGLLKRFGGKAKVSQALNEIAGEYNSKDKHDEAIELYQYVLDNWPESKYAMNSHAALARSYIFSGDTEAAEATTDELLVDFSNDDGIADAVDAIADAYRDDENYDKALELYEYVVDTWPSSEQGMGSQVSVAKLHIELEDDTAAQAAIDKLITDFSNDDGIADAVDTVADQYRDSGRYDEALQLYEEVVDTWPSTEQAAGSQVSVALINIQLGNDAEAQSAVDTLLTDYSEYTDLREGLERIAEKYESAANTDSAESLRAEISQLFPEVSESGEVELNWTDLSVLLSVESDDDAIAQAVDSLLAGVRADSGLSALAYHMAKRLGEMERYSDSVAIYQQIERYGRSSYGDKAPLNAAKDLILSEIDIRTDSEILSGVEQMITDYSGHKYLPSAVFLIARQCYRKACLLEKAAMTADAQQQFAKAAMVWEKVAESFPDLDVAVQALSRAGSAYRKLGQYGNSIDCYQAVAEASAEIVAEDDDPGYALGRDAMFFIGRNSEDLGKLSLVSQSEADAVTRSAYELLVEKYPECRVADTARRWLARH